MSTNIPIIDFGKYGMKINDKASVDSKDVEKLGKQLYEAMTTVGICYITGHGISEQLLNDYRKSSLEFFQQPNNVKQKYSRGHFPEDILGWIAREAESLNPSRPADMREAFNYGPLGDWKGMPDSFCSNFKENTSEFFDRTTALCLRVLEALTLGMGLPADNEILRCHKYVGKLENPSQTRTSYEPPILSDLKPGQVRAGEHFDYGTISIHFQDDTEGLEVCNRDGNYIPVKPIPGTAVVMPGEALHVWTSGGLIKAKHGVMAPVDEKLKSRTKLTLISYLLPDNEAVVKCLDGSDKYKPYRYLDRIIELMDEIRVVKNKNTTHI